MEFWRMAFNMECITSEQLKGAVETEQNKFGEISIEEYAKITGIEFVEE